MFSRASLGSGTPATGDTAESQLEDPHKLVRLEREIVHEGRTSGDQYHGVGIVEVLGVLRQRYGPPLKGTGPDQQDQG